MLSIPWTEHTINEKVLSRIATESTLILTIRMRYLKFLKNIMRKDNLENVTLKGRTEGNKGRGEMSRNLHSELLWMNGWAVTKYKRLWRVIIAHVLKDIQEKKQSSFICKIYVADVSPLAYAYLYAFYVLTFSNVSIEMFSVVTGSLHTSTYTHLSIDQSTDQARKMFTAWCLLNPFM